MVNHLEIESAFFEFRKMRAFLEMGVTIYIPEISYPPVPVPQDYVNSLLLVDLMSVWDRAVSHFFDFYNLKMDAADVEKSKYQVLKEAGYVRKPDYIKWYKDLRNKSAHALVRQPWSHLNQATDDITSQFMEWGLETPKLKFQRLWEEQPNGKWKLGARIGDISILEYFVQKNEVPIGHSSSAGKTIDLSFEEFLKIASQRSEEENSIIYRHF